MNEPRPIEIKTLEGLLKAMESAQLGVEWKVRCDIGPDWIGGGVLVQFYLDDRPLTETDLHNYLKQTLIEHLDIPESTVNSVITGEGEIKRVGNKLEINYDWYEAVPFAYSHASDGGKTVFIDLNQKYD